MNEELTNEDKVFSAWLNDAATSLKCVWITPKPEYITRLARMYFEERARPKVWDGAPDNATVAVVDFKRTCGDFLEPLSFEAYTRELPKTRARQIAENIVRGINDEIYSDPKDIEYVEGVLKRYAEELKEASHDK